MPQELSELNLNDDFERVLACPEASHWELGRPQPLEVLVTMSPSSSPEEIFQARLLWCVYPDQPPSLKFRDPETGLLNMPSSWPIIKGFRPQTLDACISWCQEGFNLHPEWVNDPRFRWDSSGNVLLKVLRILQNSLDEDFQGRFK